MELNLDESLERKSILKFEKQKYKSSSNKHLRLGTGLLACMDTFPLI